ncbi:hypothetical protein M2171_002564 [Bradyrhizobium japonicum USDA 38]|uniref:hypothetical protein n=1 Tax=Bradyrhizobium japonicum TaxID=375 RepID=UPI00048067F6|nr:hypothetical protein [Bradyrhizobium japonicum]MCS3893431.1 hypothetical protein [Bradyrhizobium japonicum USDA 38]MCS3945945.1 hypothetical protein [Bradyrhizobium japonicum]
MKRAQTPPKPAEVPTVATAEVVFDEDGRRIITAPLAPAPRPPASYAKLPPMPSGPRPGSLPPRPAAPVKPPPQVGPLPPPMKAAATAPSGFKRPPPPPTPARKYTGYVPPGHAVNNKGEIVRFSPDDIPY